MPEPTRSDEVTAQNGAVQCWHMVVAGTVQGVGFRPAVQRLAVRCGLSGWVANSAAGAEIHAQGTTDKLDRFRDGLAAVPAAIKITGLSTRVVPLSRYSGFAIRESLAGTDRAAITIHNDLAPCAACLREFHDPLNPRYHYPFISCTECGPRWSILRQFPYDREQTSYAAFLPCVHCAEEYRDPENRRYHHQTISCPQCGPALRLVDRWGKALAAAGDCLVAAAQQLQDGQIIALKSVGGFQLLVDARNPNAVARLRARKQRPAKPLAVMFANMAQLEHYCVANELERQALVSAERPIVLLKSRDLLPEEVAPQLATLGAMLPPSALHEALVQHCRVPLVATSGNRSAEPLCIENDDAMETLAEIADGFLIHDLEIAQALDDSVVRVINGQAQCLRGGRGMAPYVLRGVTTNVSSGAAPMAKPVLALGGHQKNTLAVALPEGLCASAHIGDLDSEASLQRFGESVLRWRALAGCEDAALVGDLHPDYGSSEWAQQSGKPLRGVQHHIAHFFSAMAEHGYRGPALGIAWDGNGLGSDGSLWGGEFFVWDGHATVERVAHFRHFRLPGGEAAIREPRRQALALLTEIDASIPTSLRAAFSDSEWVNLQKLLEHDLNCPATSSVGRLVDAVAALLLGCFVNRFEADAAMRLEALANCAEGPVTALPFSLVRRGKCEVVDWRAAILELLARQHAGEAPAELAAAFFQGLAEITVAIAGKWSGYPVFLSGGVFQNKTLTEAAVGVLASAGHQVYCHGRVPCNDGGLAVGQLYYTLACELQKSGGA